MLTIGVDAHKRVNMAVAIDAAGREVARWRGPNSVEGWRQLAAWAAELGDARWGIEGAWNYGRGLAQSLVEAGAAVYEVNARWTAAGRRRGRTPGKSDRLDARAVALVVWREAATLPPVAADDDTAVLDLLVSEREGLVVETTRLRNQLHQLLLQLDPDYRQRIPSLKSRKGLAAVVAYATDDPPPLPQQRAAAVRRLAQRLLCWLVCSSGLFLGVHVAIWRSGRAPMSDPANPAYPCLDHQASPSRRVGASNCASRPRHDPCGSGGRGTGPRHL